jgi:hypothetical protein
MDPSSFALGLLDATGAAKETGRQQETGAHENARGAVCVKMEKTSRSWLQLRLFSRELWTTRRALIC